MKKYLLMHIKTKLEFKVSFILTTISQVFVILGDVFVIYSLFSRFGSLEGFTINECFLPFSLVSLGFYISEFILRGFDQFPKLIKKGNFDLLLVRPESLITQILGSDIGLTKISRVIGFTIILIFSLITVKFNFTLVNTLILIYTLLSSVIFYGAVYIIGAALSFFFIEGIELVNILSSGTREIGEYPMGVYGKKVLKFFTFVIPLACINYYPVIYMLGYSNNILYALCPIGACLFLVPAALFFKLGMTKYQSTGS